MNTPNMTTPDNEAVKADLERLSKRTAPATDYAIVLTALDTITALQARVDEAERERDGCKIMAEGFKAQLATLRAAIAESLRRADFHDDKSWYPYACTVVEPLRNLNQPEPEGKAEPVSKPYKFPKHAADCEAMQWPRADCTCVPTQPEPDGDPVMRQILSRGQ